MGVCQVFRRAPSVVVRSIPYGGLPSVWESSVSCSKCAAALRDNFISVVLVESPFLIPVCCHAAGHSGSHIQG
jgi:hypothetical protein